MTWPAALVAIATSIGLSSPPSPALPKPAGISVTVTIARSVVVVIDPQRPCDDRVVANIPTYQTVVIRETGAGRECDVTIVAQY